MTSERDGRDNVRIFLRPIGMPVGLGAVAIFLGSTMLAGQEFGWFPAAAEQQVVGVTAVAAAAPLELLACVLAFLARDTLAGTGLGTFASIWAVSGITLLTGTPGSTNGALGTFLILGAIVLGLLIVAAGSSRAVLGAILITGIVRLVLTGLYEIFDAGGLRTASAIAGLALSASAAYAIVSLLMEDLPRPSPLPTGRKGASASSLSGSLDDQLGDLAHEAGVRRQL